MRAAAAHLTEITHYWNGELYQKISTMHAYFVKAQHIEKERDRAAEGGKIKAQKKIAQFPCLCLRQFRIIGFSAAFGCVCMLRSFRNTVVVLSFVFLPVKWASLARLSRRLLCHAHHKHSAPPSSMHPSYAQKILTHTHTPNTYCTKALICSKTVVCMLKWRHIKMYQMMGERK